jgi:hypothetical protein
MVTSRLGKESGLMVGLAKIVMRDLMLVLGIVWRYVSETVAF